MPEGNYEWILNLQYSFIVLVRIPPILLNVGLMVDVSSATTTTTKQQGAAMDRLTSLRLMGYVVLFTSSLRCAGFIDDTCGA